MVVEFAHLGARAEIRYHVAALAAVGVAVVVAVAAGVAGPCALVVEDWAEGAA